MAVEELSFFDPVRSQSVCLTDGVGVLRHEERLCVDLVFAEEGILILHFLHHWRGVEWLGVLSDSLSLLSGGLSELHLVLSVVFIWHPAEFLKDASVALEDLSVDLRILRRNLGVKVRVLDLDLQVVRYSEGLDLVWQVSQ